MLDRRAASKASATRKPRHDRTSAASVDASTVVANTHANLIDHQGLTSLFYVLFRPFYLSLSMIINAFADENRVKICE